MRPIVSTKRFDPTHNATLAQERLTMHRTFAHLILSTAFLALSLLSGCAVITVADTVAGAVVVTAATVVKTGVKATGAVIGAVIPD